MSHPYKSSRRGIAFAATLVGLTVAAAAAWLITRHDPVMAELRLAVDREHLRSTVALPARPEPPAMDPETRGPPAADAAPTIDAPPPDPSVADRQQQPAEQADPTPDPPASPAETTTDPAPPLPSELEPVEAQDSDRGPDIPLPPLPRYQNAGPFSAPADIPRIALIINELGRLDIETEAAIEAPEAVTLAFSPYGRDLATWIDRARRDGHETLIMLPMEPVDYPRDDPGPLALLTNLGASDNAERLARILAEADQSVGIIGQAGSQFLTEPPALEPVLTTLAAAGFLYVDSNPTDDAVAEIADRVELPVVEIDVMVTDTALRGAIDRRLLELETIARDRGYAVGLADAYPVFLEQLASWSERLEMRGFVLAPVTAIVDEMSAQ